MDTKTLYVSDLDGTLMRQDMTLSPFTVQAVNDLVARGLPFTYATARSIESARTITGSLKLTLPVITRNGVVLADNTTGRNLEKAVFPDEAVMLLKENLPELPRCGFVSCFSGDTMVRLYIPCEHTSELQGYLNYYKDDPFLRKAENPDDLFLSSTCYITLIGAYADLLPVYERIKGNSGWECVFQKDTYRDEYWLEICPRDCTKAKAIMKLKKEHGFEKLVVFGDSLNDLSMFGIADESYAVANAMDPVKNAATAVIGSNEEDAVARFLTARWDASHGRDWK